MNPHGGAHRYALAGATAAVYAASCADASRLLIGVEVRPGPLRLDGGGADAAIVRCADHLHFGSGRTGARGEARLAQCGRLRMLGVSSPPRRQRLRDIRGTAAFHERGEVSGDVEHMVHLEARDSSDSRVLGDQADVSMARRLASADQRMPGLRIDLGVDAVVIGVLDDPAPHRSRQAMHLGAACRSRS